MSFKQIWNTKTYRVPIIVTLSLIAFFILVNLLLSPIIDGMIKPKVLAKVNSQNTKLRIGHAGYSIFTNKIELRDIYFQQLSDTDTISFSGESVDMYINWLHLVFSDGYSFRGIEANNFVINEAFTPQKEPETKQDKNIFAFLDSLHQELQYFNSDYIIINNTTIARKDLHSGLTDSINGVNLTIREVLLDRNQKNKAGLIIAEDINLTIEKTKMFLGEINYKLFFDSLSLSSERKNISLKRMFLEPYKNDSSFFLTKKFRADRFRFFADTFSIQDIDFSELVIKSTINANKILLKNFSFDALTNMRLPVDPNAELPEMPNQVVNKIPVKLNIAKMDMINGEILVKEIYPYDPAPGVLQFAAFNASVTNIKNNNTVHFDINTRLTGSGKLVVKFNLGLYPEKMKFDYSGSLGEMNATDLNKFIVVADRVQVMSGKISKVDFKIEADGNKAVGAVTPLYSDLSVNELDDETGKASGLLEKFNSFIANTFIIRKNNPDNGKTESSTTVYIRQPDDAFMEYVWKALRTSLGEVVGFE